MMNRESQMAAATSLLLTQIKDSITGELRESTFAGLVFFLKYLEHDELFLDELEVHMRSIGLPKIVISVLMELPRNIGPELWNKTEHRPFNEVMASIMYGSKGSKDPKGTDHPKGN